MPKVRVYVTLKPSLLDSAGKTVAGSLDKLGRPTVKPHEVALRFKEFLAGA